VHAFEYLSPPTLADAIDELAKRDGAARILAGGTDLIDQMRVGKLAPEVVIDVKKVPELNVLSIDAGELRVGAAAPLCLITEHAEIREQFSCLWDSCRIIGGIQIQSRATIGGNLCNSGPAADSIPAMIALDGTCVMAGLNGSREVAVESFCTGPNKNVLGTGEVLVEVRFPARQANSGSHYRRVIPRNEMDIAVVGVGASVQLDESGENFVSARIGVGAVAATALYAQEASESLAGQPATTDSLDAAAKATQTIISPISDMRGTAEYRRHATGVLVRRVLETAIARARGEAVTCKIV
jgi:CO/xanthine dehydrogenase FAD-binding subunit